MNFNYSPELRTIDRLNVMKSENILGFRYEVFLSDTRQIPTCVCSQVIYKAACWNKLNDNTNISKMDILDK